MNKILKYVIAALSAISAALVIALKAVFLKKEKTARKRAESEAKQAAKTANTVIQEEVKADEKKEEIYSAASSDDGGVSAYVDILHQLASAGKERDKT